MAARRFLQLTDTHLMGDPAATLRGVNVLESLRRCLRSAERHFGSLDLTDAILVTGDIVNDDAAGYDWLRSELADRGVPVLCIPGNHDEPAEMQRRLAAPPFQICGHRDFDGWRIILLDSQVLGATHGRLSASELARLETALHSHMGQHALIVLHHHPVPLQSLWLDSIGLHEPEGFLALIERHTSVRGILWGHVHQSFDTLHNDVRWLATPSTCVQFAPRRDDFAIDERPPAFRSLTLHDDGRIDSEVVWVD